MKQPLFGMYDILKDKTSGLVGQVHVIAWYSTGCIHYGVAPMKLKSDGTMHEWTWLDESRFELVKKSKKKEPKNPTSGPFPHPSSR